RAAPAEAENGRPSGASLVEVRDISRALSVAGRWERLAPRLRLAARLEHPSALHVIELGLAHDHPYVVLESAEAATVAAAVAASGPKTRDAAIELVRSLAGALEEAHRLGLAHGHLGPGHIWFADGKPPKLDFTGIDAGFPAGSDLSRALDSACRDPAT